MKDHELGWIILLANLVAIFILYWTIRKAVAHGLEDYHENQSINKKGVIETVTDAIQFEEK
jgi:hypothetical protein